MMDKMDNLPFKKGHLKGNPDLDPQAQKYVDQDPKHWYQLHQRKYRLYITQV